MLRTVGWALGTLALSLAPVLAHAAEEAVYVEGGQYTATLDQRSGQWHLLPAAGGDVSVASSDGRCGPSQVPPGVWLLVHGDHGPELIAPSNTALPQGHPGRLALRACGAVDDGEPAVHAPGALVQWMADTVGAVRIDD